MTGRSYQLAYYRIQAKPRCFLACVVEWLEWVECYGFESMVKRVGDGGPKQTTSWQPWRYLIAQTSMRLYSHIDLWHVMCIIVVVPGDWIHTTPHNTTLTHPYIHSHTSIPLCSATTCQQVLCPIADRMHDTWMFTQQFHVHSLSKNKDQRSQIDDCRSQIKKL